MGFIKAHGFRLALRRLQQIFHSTMLNIVTGISRTIIYLNDILIFLNNVDEHNTILNRVLQRLENHNVQLNKQKLFLKFRVLNYRSCVDS